MWCTNIADVACYFNEIIVSHGNMTVTNINKHLFQAFSETFQRNLFGRAGF